MDELRAVEEAEQVLILAEECRIPDDRAIHVRVATLRALLARAMRPHD